MFTNADGVCLSPLNRDSDLETQRRQNNNMEVEHAFIARRQISDPDENVTRESPEVILIHFLQICICLVWLCSAYPASMVFCSDQPVFLFCFNKKIFNHVFVIFQQLSWHSQIIAFDLAGVSEKQ